MARLVARIVLKSGAVVKIRVKSLTVKKNGFGEFKTLEWVSSPGRRMLHIDVNQISAVTTRRTWI
jgi:hypothetical protein